MPAVLLVEDDATIAMGVEYSLKQEGFQVRELISRMNAVLRRRGPVEAAERFTTVVQRICF